MILFSDDGCEFSRVIYTLVKICSSLWLKPTDNEYAIVSRGKPG